MTSIWKNTRGLLIIVAIVVVVLAGVLQSMEPKVWMSIMLSGATLAALYFLVASGLSLIFGLMADLVKDEATIKRYLGAA